MLFGPNIDKLKSKRDIEGLKKALDHKKREVRKEAAEALVAVGGVEVLPALLHALKNQEAGVRVCAVQGLARIKAPEAETALKTAIDDPDWEVRKESLDALVKSSSCMNPHLLAALQFDSAELREIAVVRLGEVGGQEAAPHLISALQDEEELVRLRAARALGKLKNPESVEALLQAVQDPDTAVRNAAQQALQWVEQSSAVDAPTRHRVREALQK